MILPPVRALRAFFLVSGLLACFSTSQSAQAQYLYGITDGGSLYEVNPIAQYTGLVYTQTLTMSSANGLAWDEAGQRLFYFGTVSGTTHLYVWNRATNTQTQLGGTLPGGSVTSGTYYNNSFWYVKNATDTLVRMNLDFTIPAAPTVSSFVQYTNFDGTAVTSYSFGDISVRASDGIMYGSSDKGIFKVDISGASPTAFSQISSNSTMYQIGFGQNAVLYGETAADGKWYTVNQSTGVASTMNYTSTKAGGTVVAFNDISEGALQGVFGAPEPGSLSLLGMGLVSGVGSTGIAARRRKNAKQAL